MDHNPLTPPHTCFRTYSYAVGSNGKDFMGGTSPQNFSFNFRLFYFIFFNSFFSV